MTPITEVMKIITVMDTMAASGRPKLQVMLKTRRRVQMNHYFSHQKALLDQGPTERLNTWDCHCGPVPEKVQWSLGLLWM